MMPSIWQLLIVLLIIVLLFGTKRLKSIGSDLGGALKGFKKAVDDKDADFPETSAKVEEQKQDASVVNTKESAKQD